MSGLSSRRLDGRVALVTGGAGGLGDAFARELGRRGAAVVVTDVDLQGAERVADAVRAAGGDAWAEPLDVTDPGAWERLADALDAAGRRPTILINNAGIGAMGLAMDVPLETWRRVFDVCFWGLLYGCRIFGGRWLERGDAGTIINISSAGGFLGLPQANAYAAAKAGVMTLTHTLSCELDPRQIQLTTVCPAGVRTGIGAACEQMGTADATTSARIRRFLEMPHRTPDQVARAALDGALRGRPMVKVYAESWALDALRRLLPTRCTIALGRLLGTWLMADAPARADGALTPG